MLSGTRGAHENIDPVTGGCLDCGASREDFDDNLVPTCEKASGPNRIAIIVARKELRFREHEIAAFKSQMYHGERLVVALSRTIREKEAEREQLIRSIDKLVSG